MTLAHKRYQSSLAGIDLLRFLLSLTVVVFHYRMFLRPFTGREKVATSKLPLHSVLQFIYNHGGYAVEIFWLISGFIFYRIYADAIAGGKVSIKTFSLLRFSRLYPLHFATLIIVAILQYSYQSVHGSFFAYPSNDIASFIRHLFFVSQWGDYGNSFNAPVWSVSVEIFVYFLFFFVSAAGLLSGRRIFIIAGVASLGYLLKVPAQFYECIYYFFTGCLLCFFYNRNIKPLYLFTALAGICIILAIPVSLGIVKDWIYDWLRTSAGIAGSSLLLMLFIYGFAGLKHKKLLFFVKSLGDITYSTYMVHFPIQLALMLIINPHNDSIFRSTYMLAFFIAIVIVTAAIVYAVYERPVQNYLRKRWLL